MEGLSTVNFAVFLHAFVQMLPYYGIPMLLLKLISDLR